MIVAAVIPSLMVALIWCIYFVCQEMAIKPYSLGIFPRTFEGLAGVLTSPLIHDMHNTGHILSNTFPLLVLGWSLFYYYREVAMRVLSLVWIIGGFWVWVSARESYHIGASGIIYGLAAFIFFSGMIRNDRRLLSISLLVTFLYGSMIWGIFPIDPGISFEGHFWGMMAGGILAFYYKATDSSLQPERAELLVDPDFANFVDAYNEQLSAIKQISATSSTTSLSDEDFTFVFDYQKDKPDEEIEY